MSHERILVHTWIEEIHTVIETVIHSTIGNIWRPWGIRIKVPLTRSRQNRLVRMKRVFPVQNLLPDAMAELELVDEPWVYFASSGPGSPKLSERRTWKNIAELHKACRRRESTIEGKNYLFCWTFSIACTIFVRYYDWRSCALTRRQRRHLMVKLQNNSNSYIYGWIVNWN